MKRTFFAFFILPFAFTAPAFAAYGPLDYYNAGAALFQKGQYVQAAAYLQYAVQLNPNYWQAYQLLGSCYYGEKNNGMAIQEWDKSLDINPDNPGLQQFEEQVLAQTQAAASPAEGAPTSSNGPPVPNVSSLPVQPRRPAMDFSFKSWVNPDLPKQGGLEAELELGPWVGDTQDLDNFYGTDLSSTEFPLGENYGGLVDLALSQDFLLGLKLEMISKPTNTVSLDSGADTEIWQENAFGFSVDGQYLADIDPDDGIIFVAQGDLGYFSLSNSTFTDSSEALYTNLSGSGLGAMVNAGVELPMDSKKTWAFDFLLGYRLLSLSPITASINSHTETFYNADGSKASVDFSGFQLSIAAVLFNL